MTADTPRRAIARLLAAVAAACAVALTLPATALAHQLMERYRAPLPLVAYVAGAALAVAVSFAFVILRNPRPPDETRSRSREVPVWLRRLLSLIGLVAWLWIIAQTAVGVGSGDADVASLFVWVYGWVGLGLISSLIGPAWAWIDPFTTLHRILGWLGRRLRLAGAQPARYPERLGRWPAVVGLAAVVWVELVGRVEGGRTLGLLLVAYTLLTLAGMSYFGRETWRARTEVFSVWFGLLGRLAPFALDGEPEEGRVRRRPFGAGLLSGAWSADQLVLLAIGTGSIIFDGLSQTQIYFELFGGLELLGAAVVRDTVLLALFLGGLSALVLLVARRVDAPAVGAGLLPVAIGYLIAHYLSYLLVEGQRIVHSINDPLLRGDNLLPFDIASYQPQLFMPTAVLWSIQLAAVVGGHVFGAWAGHAALARTEGRAEPVRQLPLAATMVVLTSLTLWSLGQSVLIETPTAGLQ